ncbi:MAG: hypothetical protein ACOZAR_01220 [Patescibacteria group bacterium]
MNTKISDKVLEKIKDDKIKPIPRWWYVLKNTLIWLLLIVLLLLGAAMTSLSLGDIIDGDWDIRPMMGVHLLTFIFMTFPFTWVALGLVIIFLAYYDFKYLPKSYKIGGQKYLIIIISIVLASGLGMYYIGGHNPVKRLLSNFAPVNDWEKQKDMRWMNPGQGLLAGKIVEVNNEDSFVLQDILLNQQWTIDISQAKIAESVNIAKDEKIKMIGEMKEGNNFVAKDVRPWQKGKDKFLPPPPPPIFDDEKPKN